MGYFSNGSDGADYQDRYCNRCIHDIKQDCPVWMLHLAFNYEQLRQQPNQQGPTRQILSALIPERKDHLGNEQCKLFVELAVTK